MRTSNWTTLIQSSSNKGNLVIRRLVKLPEGGSVPNSKLQNLEQEIKHLKLNQWCEVLESPKTQKSVSYSPEHTLEAVKFFSKDEEPLAVSTQANDQYETNEEVDERSEHSQAYSSE